MRRNATYLLSALTIVAAIVRFATLDLQSFHHDEAVTAGTVLGGGLGSTLDHIVDGERSPPLYYVLAWAWSQLFGTGEVGLRSLSALIGTLMVPAAFWAGRNLADVRVGLVAALFFALNPYLVYYSQEARSYILMTLFALVAIGACAHWHRAGCQRSLWIWAITSALALSAHYFAAFLIGPQLIWLLHTVRPRSQVAPPIAAMSAVALALLPLAIEQQGGDRADSFTDSPLIQRVGEVGLNYVAGEEPSPLAGDRAVDALQIGAALGGLALIALAVFILARSAPETRKSGLGLGGLIAAAIGLPALLAIAGIDLLNPRNLIAGLLPVLLLAALAFGSGRGRLQVIGIAATALMFTAVVAAVNVSEQMQRKNWRGAAETIGPAESTRLLVIPKNGDDPLEYYLGATKFRSGRFADGVEVSEIEVLSTNFAVEPPSNFEQESEQGLAPLFILRTFRADRPVVVTPGDLDGVLSGRFELLIDRP